MQNTTTKKNGKGNSNVAQLDSNPAKAAADKLSEAEGKEWASKRESILAELRPQVANLPLEKLQELAAQRVARILDEKHNSAESKREVLAGKAAISLDGLLASNRLSAAAKEVTQDSFLALLTSGKLNPSQLAEAAEVFKSGKLKEMAAFVFKIQGSQTPEA